MSAFPGFESLVFWGLSLLRIRRHLCGVVCIRLCEFDCPILADPSPVIFELDCAIYLQAEAALMSKEAACEFFEILLGFLVALA